MTKEDKTKQLPSKFEQLNNELKSKVEGLEREKEHAASELIPRMYDVLIREGYTIIEARMTVFEYAGEYLSHWSIRRNLPDEAKDESHVIGGKASAEAREKKRLDQESRQTYRIVLEEEDVKRILQMYVVDNVRRMEIEKVAPGDVRIRGLETVTQARSN